MACPFQTKISLATAGLYCTTSQLPLFRVRWKFHSLGPAAANPLSSKMSTSQLTMHVRHVVDRTHSPRSRTSAKRRRSLARYDDEMPDSDRWTSVATLKSTLWRTGSQCSWRSTGFMWSGRRVPVTRGRRRSEPIATGSPVLPRYIPKNRVAVV